MEAPMNPHVPPFGENDRRPGAAVSLPFKPAEMSENEAKVPVRRVAEAAILNIVGFIK